MSLCKVGNQTSSQDPQAVNSRIFVGNLNTFQVTKTDVEKVSLSIHSILKVPSFPFCHLTFHQLLFFLIKHLFQAQAGAISFFKLQLLTTKIAWKFKVCSQETSLLSITIWGHCLVFNWYNDTIYFYVSGLKNSVELFTQSEALEWQFKSLGKRPFYCHKLRARERQHFAMVSIQWIE